VQILGSQFIGNGNARDPGGQEHALYVGVALNFLLPYALNGVGHHFHQQGRECDRHSGARWCHRLPIVEP